MRSAAAFEQAHDKARASTAIGARHEGDGIFNLHRMLLGG
jgi:hypothetical protein